MPKRKREENLDASLNTPFAEVNSLVKQVHDILTSEITKVSKEKEAFDAVAQKLKHVQFSKILKLNVGGQVFSTSLETVKKDPGSMLHAMFSERFDTKATEDGSYFIDRDGTHFRYILNYLRTGQLLVPEDKTVYKELLAEAEFYQIQGIVDELRARPFKDSLILSEEQRQTLVEWLNDTFVSAGNDYVLLYRASRDGWASTNFHRCCDLKGSTVTVIRSGKYIFGGYTEQQWEAYPSGDYKNAPNTFLFSLVNSAGLEPTTLPLMPNQEGRAVYCNSGIGPCFGGGSDLRVMSGPNTNSCSTSLNHSFQCPTGQNPATFLAGNQAFTVTEMEVFGYQK